MEIEIVKDVCLVCGKAECVCSKGSLFHRDALALVDSVFTQPIFSAGVWGPGSEAVVSKDGRLRWVNG